MNFALHYFVLFYLSLKAVQEYSPQSYIHILPQYKWNKMQPAKKKTVDNILNWLCILNFPKEVNN